ncbi:MAG: helix-turn-helix transcriptional regulator [Desulfobacteraceae bacterium]|jgi:DNA-binding PadR family transcriptional regulator|nr:helix-turn-helix transcriptional regulator [Desulfobacteraceae bacterium]
MPVPFEDCPCSGKSMSNLAAPWILLTLFHHEGVHGYEITRIIRQRIESLGLGLNMTGLYRHLNHLEKRGMLLSEWDTSQKGPARKKYFLTDAGRECLWRWMQTLTTQMTLIGELFDHARGVFPESRLPRIDLSELHPGGGRKSGSD